MSHIVVLLVILLSKPGDPVVFGVVHQFPDIAACYRAIERVDATPKEKEAMACLPVLKPQET